MILQLFLMGSLAAIAGMIWYKQKASRNLQENLPNLKVYEDMPIPINLKVYEDMPIPIVSLAEALDFFVDAELVDEDSCDIPDDDDEDPYTYIDPEAENYSRFFLTPSTPTITLTSGRTPYDPRH